MSISVAYRYRHSYIDKDEDEISAKIKQIREIRTAGLTNLQSGHSSDHGVNNAEVWQRELSYEEFEDQPDLKYCIIKINDFLSFFNQKVTNAPGFCN